MPVCSPRGKRRAVFGSPFAVDSAGTMDHCLHLWLLLSLLSSLNVDGRSVWHLVPFRKNNMITDCKYRKRNGKKLGQTKSNGMDGCESFQLNVY